MASFVYNLYKQHMMSPPQAVGPVERVDLSEAAHVKVALLGSTYPSTEAAARNHTHTQVMAYEVTGTTNYAVATLGTTAVALSTNNAYFDAADVTWANSTIASARFAYVYWDGTGNDLPVCVIDFGANYSSTSADFTIQWNAAGIMVLVHVASNGCYIYNNAKLGMLKGEYFWTHFNGDGDTDAFKVTLHTSTYTPLPAHETLADATNQVEGTGYTAGGATLAGKTRGTSTNTISWTGSQVEWTSATITARYAVVYNDTVTDDLIALIDLQEDKTATNGLFRITWNAAGIVTVA